MSANRISTWLPENEAPPPAGLPNGFAVCQLGTTASSPLAIQLLAQQQAYEQAIAAAQKRAFALFRERLTDTWN